MHSTNKFENGSYIELLKKLADISTIEGAEALRISKLYYGGPVGDYKIPETDIFVQNVYKKYDIPTMSIDRIDKIIKYNSFTYFERTYKDKSMSSLYCFCSLLNHNHTSNLLI